MKTLENMTEPELRGFCNTLAGGIEFMAGDCGVERPLFVLLLFNDPKIAQYVANTSRDNIVRALRETADRLERKEDVTR